MLKHSTKSTTELAFCQFNGKIVTADSGYGAKSGYSAPFSKKLIGYIDHSILFWIQFFYIALLTLQY